MTSVSLAAKNFLAQQADVVALLGSSNNVPWVFNDTPEVNIERSGKAMIVVSVVDGWTGANTHNTARFPRLVIDIWVDPSRNSDGSVKVKDAKIKAEAIYKAVDKYLHLMNANVGGASVIWGTASQIANKTGTRIIASTRSGEPSYTPAFDNQGATVATIRYDLQV